MPLDPASIPERVLRAGFKRTHVGEPADYELNEVALVLAAALEALMDDEPVVVDAGGKWMNDHAPSFAAVPSVVLAAVLEREGERHVHKWSPDALSKSMLPAYKCACGAKR